MTDYEKVLFTLIEQKQNELKDLAEKDTDPDNIDLSRPLDQKIMALKKEKSLLSKMMWSSIRKRIPGPEEGKIILRKGFRITHSLLTEEEKFDEMMSSLSGGMIVMGIHHI